MSHQPRSREEKQQLSMIEGSIWRSMIAFAVPIFLGNLFQQFYNAADALIVGNFIGKEALAAVGQLVTAQELTPVYLRPAQAERLRNERTQK